MTTKATFSYAPFVARISERNEVEIVERAGDLICESTGSVVFLTRLLGFCFGSVFAYLVWTLIVGRSLPHVHRSEQVPWFVIFFLAILGLVCWFSFFRSLFGAPHFVVRCATGDIDFFRSRTRQPWRTIHPSEISHFAIEPRMYMYKATTAENSVLILLTTTGERVSLCASPDKALISSLGEKLATRTQRKIETNTTA